jgi:hypothetical protein
VRDVGHPLLARGQGEIPKNPGFSSGIFLSSARPPCSSTMLSTESGITHAAAYNSQGSPVPSIPLLGNAREMPRKSIVKVTTALLPTIFVMNE